MPNLLVLIFIDNLVSDLFRLLSTHASRSAPPRPTWSNGRSNHGLSRLKSRPFPQVCHGARVLPWSWYPPGDSMGYMAATTPAIPMAP